MRALIAAAALLTAAPAFAQTPATHAVLADAASAPTRPLIVDGASWRCEGAECVATGGSEQPATRACRRAAQRLGQLTAFSWKGVALNETQLAACNAG